MYTNEFKSCLKSVKIPAVVPCFVVVIRGCVVIGRWVDLRTVFLWWILGSCGVPGYPLFVFLASVLGGLMCGVPVCGPVLCFVFFATILLLLHVCVLLRGVSVPCFFVPWLLLWLVCVSFFYVCMVAVCLLSLVAVWLLFFLSITQTRCLYNGVKFTSGLLSLPYGLQEHFCKQTVLHYSFSPYVILHINAYSCDFSTRSTSTFLFISHFYYFHVTVSVHTNSHFFT